MRPVELTKAGPADYPSMEAIYTEAFPDHERMPFAWMISQYEKGQAIFLKAGTDGKTAGLLYLAGWDDLLYLFYFAVQKDQRGAGLGSAILDALKQKYPDKILFLAREPLDRHAENAAQRESRVRFYERNGFQTLPYDIWEGDNRFICMATSPAVSPASYNELARAWMQGLGLPEGCMRMTETG